MLLNSFGLLRSRVALSIIEELWETKEMSKMSVKSEYDKNDYVLKFKLHLGNMGIKALALLHPNCV